MRQHSTIKANQGTSLSHFYAVNHRITIIERRGEHMLNIYSEATLSSSATYANVAAFVREYILTNFPKNFFQYDTVSTELAYRNIRRQTLSSRDDEIAKRKTPYLVIRPQVQPPNPDMYLSGTLFTTNIDNLEAGIDMNDLFPIVMDRDSKYQLRYRLNRDQVAFNCTITLKTYTSLIDTMKYMKNHFLWDRPFTKPAYLEAMIPKNITCYMGLLSNIDINKNPEINAPLMVRHLNKNSMYPITYKVRNSTSKDEYFIYYRTPVLLTLSDFDVDEPSLKGMVQDNVNISFKVIAEFNMPGIFYLMGERPRIATDVEFKSIDFEHGDDMIPMYTIQNLYGEYASKFDNYKLLNTAIINTERDKKTGKDVVGTDVLIDEDYLKIIRRAVSYNEDPSTLMRILVMKNSQELAEGTDWVMDWNSFDLTINDPDDTATYRILLYGNNIKINERLMDLIEDNKTEQPPVSRL